ncbi:MAG TPA: ferritin family protein [Bacteroidales bacterium]|nr:ferritin family protein [Bacteroidales bacterium]
MDMYKQILSQAILNEIEAYEFYKSAAEKSANASLKEIFSELAEEENKHKIMLEAFLNSNVTVLNFHTTADYKVSESVELPKLTPDMSFTDGLALAMKKEEEAMVMYQKFADASSSEEQKHAFIQLAKMEQGHKARLEELYTNTAYIEEW